MDSVKQALELVLQILVRLGDFVVGAILAVEVWLRGRLGAMGAPPEVQTAILIAVAILLILMAFRLFGGLVRIAVVVVLLLIAMHVLLPVISH